MCEFYSLPSIFSKTNFGNNFVLFSLVINKGIFPKCGHHLGQSDLGPYLQSRTLCPIVDLLNLNV